MAFERVARVCDIPEGRGLCVRLRDREVGLYRFDGRVYAMQDVCPHAGYPLSDGEMDGRIVICAGHGWSFDLVTGLAPGEIDEEPLERYPVRIEGDEVWLDPDAPIEGPAD